MKIDTALILCAGYGKRLQPLTLTKPKPLLKINELTLLENTINIIKKLDIKNIKINTFYLKEKIKHFVSNKNLDVNIEVIDEGEKILNTGGGILNMIKSSKEENFIVFNPDTIWNNNYLGCIEKMKKFYFSENINNVLLVANKSLSYDKSLNGDFNLSNNILEKTEINNFIFTGCQIINKKLFEKMTNKSFSILDIWNQLIKEKKLFGYESKNIFYHITNLEIYNKILKDK
tara:strand:+ start:475 stop:1167 length:693 start_codon:yes stop_codon:yes gene_type:complete